MQSIIRLIYPAECLMCRARTETEFALCGDCWRETEFVDGLVCDTCGAPLIGEERECDVICDDCISTARPWEKGRAALLYSGNGRRLVLSLKHGDRTDLARPCGGWMAQAAQPLIQEDTLIVPVPLHWTRLLRRQYNQSAILAQILSRKTGRPMCADALVRSSRTPLLGGKSKDERFAILTNCIRSHPQRGAKMRGKAVLLVDDVMTSGATLTACTEAAYTAGARTVSIVTLARAVKNP